MDIRKSTLWRVPAFCIAAGCFSWYATIWLGRYFYVVTEMGADGIPTVSADPVRSALFNTVLFVLLLLAGGLWLHRDMSRREIASSAATASSGYLLILLGQLFLPGVMASGVIVLSMIQNWVTIPGGLLWSLLGKAANGVHILIPFLLVLFGKSQKDCV